MSFFITILLSWVEPLYAAHYALNGTQEIDLGDIPQANPSPKDLLRNKGERELLNKVWQPKEGPGMFELPLGKPAKLLPDGILLR